MEKWEYLTVVVYDLDWAATNGQSGTFQDYIEADNSAANQLEDNSRLLNQLGGDGWELTGVAGSESYNTYKLFFKRKK
jgi:hypothetical protein